MELKELHEEVFKFLLEKRKADPSLRYTLRSYNTGERLDKGYWFLGSETNNSLYVSFWNVYGVLEHKGLQHPAILFEIDVNGQSNLFIDTNGFNKQHRQVLEKIARSLELETKNDILWRTRTSKINVQNKFKALEDFATTQRPFINSFFKLRGVENDFPSIGEIEFTARFDKIQKLREKLESQKDAVVFADFIKHNKRKLFVETLQLTNINAFKSLNISFDKQVTCFVGGNGSGKTTILRAIALGLVGVNGLKNPPKFLAIDEAKKDTIKYQKEGSIDVFYQYENEPTQDFGVEYKSLDNGKASSEPQNSKKEGGLLTTDKSTLKTLVVGFAQQGYGEAKISERQFPNMGDLEALLIAEEPDNRFEEFAQWFKAGLNQDLSESKDFRILISKIIGIINICIRKNEEGESENDIDFVGTTKIYLTTKNNPKGIPIEKLSQGYRNLLAWVGFFAKRMHEYQLSLVEEGVLPKNINFMDLPAVCLIDEIDTYLHPDWQYSILKGLVESFPNVQFFITSHSPFVLTSVPSDKITIYELETKTDGKESTVVAHKITNNLYGADANRSTNEISDERITLIKDELMKIDNHIENGELVDAEKKLNALKIDKADIAFVLAKRKIQIKKLSITN